MRLFKKTTKGTTPDELAEKIAHAITTRQRRIAGYLNKKVRNIPVKFRFCGFILFCTAFGGYCIYLFINAIK